MGRQWGVNIGVTRESADADVERAFRRLARKVGEGMWDVVCQGGCDSVVSRLVFHMGWGRCTQKLVRNLPGAEGGRLEALSRADAEVRPTDA